MDVDPNSGVYIITIRRSGAEEKFYVGKSINLRKRKAQHFGDLRARRHHNILLQRAWDKYGQESFEFKIVAYGNPCDLIAIEQSTLDTIMLERGDESVLNILTLCVDKRLGIPHTAETRATLSRKQADNWKDPVYREASIIALTAACNRPGMRERMSIIQKEVSSRPEIKEVRRLLGIAYGLNPLVKARRKAANLRPDVRAKRSASGVAAKTAPGIREEISAVQKVIQNRPEIKAKIAATRGTPEYRRRISDRRRAIHATDTYRELQRAAQLVAQNRPETKAKRAASMARVFADPAQTAKRRAVEATPEVKAKRLAVGRLNAARYQALRDAKALAKGDKEA